MLFGIVDFLGWLYGGLFVWVFAGVRGWFAYFGFRHRGSLKSLQESTDRICFGGGRCFILMGVVGAAHNLCRLPQCRN